MVSSNPMKMVFMPRTLSQEERISAMTAFQNLDKQYCNIYTYDPEGKNSLEMNPFHYQKTWAGKNWKRCFYLYCDSYNQLFANIMGDPNMKAFDAEGMIKFIDTHEFTLLCNAYMDKMTRGHEIQFFCHVTGVTSSGLIQISQETAPVISVNESGSSKITNVTASKDSYTEDEWKNMIKIFQKVCVYFFEKPNGIPETSHLDFGPHGFIGPAMMYNNNVNDFLKPILKRKSDDKDVGCSMSVFSYLLMRMIIDRKIIIGETEEKEETLRSNSHITLKSIEDKIAGLEETIVSKMMGTTLQHNGGKLLSDKESDALAEKISKKVMESVNKEIRKMDDEYKQHYNQIVSDVIQFLLNQQTKQPQTSSQDGDRNAKKK